MVATECGTFFETLFLKTELKMSNKTQLSLVQSVKSFKIFMSNKQLVLRSVWCGFPNRVLHDLSAIQECQYYQLCFGCAIQN